VTQSTTAPGDEAFVTGYEALRAQAVGLGRTGGTSASLLVLLGQGMAAWMARRSPSPEPVLTVASPRVDPRHAALVSALASMAIGVTVTVFKEARA
jgi:hypothetical protein